MKKLLGIVVLSLFIFIVSSVLVLCAFEVFLKSNPTKYHSYGWVKNNEIEKITKDCANKSGQVGVFGDSFVEYYRDTSDNITNMLKAELEGTQVCNFGLSGTGLDVYLARFKYVINKANIQKAVFYFYEGNDFFAVNKIDQIKAASSYDRVNHLIFEKLKQSAALNFIYREIFKPLTSREITFEDSQFEACLRPSDEEIKVKLDLLRVNQSDLYKKFANNQLNVSWLQVALNCPSYFEVLSKKIDNQNYAVVKDTLYKGFFLSTTNSLKLEELSQNEIVESLELIERSDLVMGQVIFYHLDDSSLSKVDLEQLTKVL